MKNLELLEISAKTFPNSLTDIKNFTTTTDCIYYINDNLLYKCYFSKNDVVELTLLQFENVITLKYLPIEHKICIVDEFNLSIIDPELINETLTINFEESIETVSWSPTEETLAIIFTNGTITTYSIDYQEGCSFLKGTNRVDGDVPGGVYVGWGSEGTQFRGPQSKLKATSQPIEIKPIEDRKPQISWRGNGEMFAVNYWIDNKRVFTVFELPCRALFRSENCPGLQPHLAWRPTGNMIAAITEVNSKTSGIIFEKNGQKRFDFDLTSYGIENVSELKWSPCANVLAIRTENNGAQAISLLTSSNYKWFEKQKLVFEASNPLLYFDWLESSPSTYTLIIITASNVVKYTFRNVITRFGAVCGVVDGNVLKITDFKNAVVPPIMSETEIKAENAINLAYICENNKVAIVDCYNKLRVYNLLENKLETEVDLSLKVEIKFPFSLHHFFCLSSQIYFCSEDLETTIYSLNRETEEIDFITAITDHPRHIFIEQKAEKLAFDDLQKVSDSLYINCSENCTLDQSLIALNNNYFNCQLNNSGNFYVNDTKIAASVSSFIISDNYLLYTTKLNELYCVRLGDKTLETIAKNATFKRSIEQGGTIVTMIPGTSHVVLQMPRGNLETISCRLIAIDTLDRLLNENEWSQALYLIRSEKLNANLLIDLDPERFIKNIDKFVNSVPTFNELNRVCLEIEDTNCLETLYKYWGKSPDFPDKSQQIFLKLLNYFEEIDYANYINTIVIVKLHYFSLKEALIPLLDLYHRSRSNPALEKSLKSAINSLKTYGIEDKLFNESLALYDLDFANHIASCCQMDPRIYQPQIKNLKNLSEIERRYEINVLIKQFKSAIAYLLRIPGTNPDVIKHFIENHKLWPEAYEQCPLNNPNFPLVSRAFAHYLSRKQNYHEAGVVLKRAQLLKEALDQFKLALSWREVLDLAQKLNLSDLEVSIIINELGSGLRANGRVKDAADLYENYGKNYEMAVKVLIEKCYFREAYHLANKYSRKDILVCDVNPALIKHFEYLKDKSSEIHETFKKYRSRLAKVRNLRVEKLNNVYYEDDERDQDLFSEGGSVITSRSSRSRMSTLSSRNRRKEERKKQDLREGGFYEDIALIRALSGLIKEIDGRRLEVADCCSLLLQETDKNYKIIKGFYEYYQEIVIEMKRSFSEIWPPHFYLNNPTQDVREKADLENIEHLDAEFRTPPRLEDSNLLLFS